MEQDSRQRLVLEFLDVSRERIQAEYRTLVHYIDKGSKGGSNEPNNLQTMCRVCNSRKGATLDGGHLN